MCKFQLIVSKNKQTNQNKIKCLRYEVWLQPIRYGNFFGNIKNAGSQLYKNEVVHPSKSDF